MDNDEIEEEYKNKTQKLKIKFIAVTVLVAVIVAIFSSEFTLYYYTREGLPLKAEVSEKPDENINVIATSLKNFRSLIDEVYIGEIDEQKILDETIKGYVRGLDDEYSEYMTAEEWEEFQTNALGNYAGVGIIMSVDKNENVVVLKTIKDSPAEKAGIMTGDIITFIDEENVIGMSSEEVSNKIKGELGTKVKITVYRNEDYLDFDLERAEIKLYHVEEQMLENNIGYISLITFDENCSEEFENSYKKLKEQGAKKLIVDLRDNTGGLVEESLKIIDMFLPKDKTMLITVDSSQEKEYSKSKTDALIDIPVVVLTNEYSASASEIMVGALKDNNVAKSVGKTTFGKGVIQSVFSLKDGSALKLTISEYFTPNETKINKVGIAPDYEVELNPETEDDEQLNKAVEILNQ